MYDNISYPDGLPKKSGIDKLSTVTLFNVNSSTSLSTKVICTGSNTIHDDKSCVTNGVGVGVGSSSTNDGGVGVAVIAFVVRGILSSANILISSRSSRPVKNITIKSNSSLFLQSIKSM